MLSVAIIMRAKNEMPHVARTLDMLQRQTLQNFDLYAVDSGSTDGTLEALQKSCPAEKLRQIAPEEYVPGTVLNQAIERTHHDIIILLNADAVPLATDFIEKLIAPLVSGAADAVFAKQAARSDARFIVDYDYQRAYNEATMLPTFFSAVACAFRRDLWETNRFRETGYAEDLAWAESGIKSGARIRFVPEAIVEHSHNYSLKGLYHKRRRQAETFGERPALPRQAAACLREIVRDLLHAVTRLKFHTIPYNTAYRVAIYAGLYRGLRNAWKNA